MSDEQTIQQLQARIAELERERKQWEADELEWLKHYCKGPRFLPLDDAKRKQAEREAMELKRAVELASRLRAERDAAQQQVKALRELLSQCRSDIFQTARSNQCNLTGLDIVTPDDPPIPTRIGKCHVHQIGINESLQLVKRVEAALRSTGH